MSDGPTKLTPEAPLLDDIILGEDDAPALAPVADARASVTPPRPKAPSYSGGSVPPPGLAGPLGDARLRSSERPPERADSDPDAKERKRSKMTLRIPDDEVARPSASPPAEPAPPSAPGGPPLQPSPIISIGEIGVEDTISLSAEEMRARMETVDDGTLGGQPARAPGVMGAEDSWTPYQRMVTEPVARADVSIPPGPASEDIPIETESLEQGLEGELHASGALPEVELHIEDDAEPAATDVPELAMDDLEAVESNPHPPPLKTGAPKTSGAALMAGLDAPEPAVVVAVPAAAPAPPPVAATSAAVDRAKLPPVALPAGIGAVTPAPITIPSGLGGPAAAAQAPAKPGSFPPVAAPNGLAPPPMSEAAFTRKKTRPWWEELFNDDFIRTMAKVTDRDIGREVDFIEESLGLEAGATILDLACGTGRHAVELATRGYQVVGYDLSLAMLARASDEAQDRKQKLNFVQGDMREMQFEETFDGIFSWNTSFGFFDEEKNNAVVAKVHRALKKGGQFLLDVVNRDYIVRQAPSLAWFEGDGCICMDEMQIDFITSRMKVKRTLMMDDGRTKEIEYSIRVYALHELGKMLHDNGFRVTEVSGRMGTPGVFFGCEAPRILILAEKR